MSEVRNSELSNRQIVVWCMRRKIIARRLVYLSWITLSSHLGSEMPRCEFISWFSFSSSNSLHEFTRLVLGCLIFVRGNKIDVLIWSIAGYQHLSVRERDDFCSGIATKMIFARSSPRRGSRPPFGPCLVRSRSHSFGWWVRASDFFVAGAPRGDLVHSASHNFIRPDHGSLGTLWQMYPSANFKLVPAV